MSQKTPELRWYGQVRWHALDVKLLTSGKDGKPRWTRRQSEAWLKRNDKYIRERMIELGWEVIRDLMPAEPNSKNHKE